MSLEVIGAGWGRTGTLSLKHALEQLGFGPVYHMYEVYQEDHVQRWLDGDLGVLDEYQATVDWPGCSFWRELTELHPDAKVILSTRDAELWWQSFNSTVAGVIHRACSDRHDPCRASPHPRCRGRMGSVVQLPRSASPCRTVP